MLLGLVVLKYICKVRFKAGENEFLRSLVDFFKLQIISSLLIILLLLLVILLTILPSFSIVLHVIFDLIFAFDVLRSLVDGRGECWLGWTTSRLITILIQDTLHLSLHVSLTLLKQSRMDIFCLSFCSTIRFLL